MVLKVAYTLCLLIIVCIINYALHINSRLTCFVKFFLEYPVSAFDGSKKMILSTTSLLGGKNPFLGIAYIVVGCICLILGIALLIIHIKCSKRFVIIN